MLRSAVLLLTRLLPEPERLADMGIRLALDRRDFEHTVDLLVAKRLDQKRVASLTRVQRTLDVPWSRASTSLTS